MRQVLSDKSQEGFFGRYREFYDSDVSAHPFRLQFRYQRIIEWNRSWLQGRRVLDLACHDGRWGCAALDSGAGEVVGIEMAPPAIQRGRAIIGKYGFNMKIVEADLLEWLYRTEETFEVVFCLGYFYHTGKHVALAEKIAEMNPELVVFDTTIADKIRYFVEGGDGDPASSYRREIVSVPSRWLVELMSQTCFQEYQLEWFSAPCPKHDSIDEDYGAGKRVTFRFRRES